MFFIGVYAFEMGKNGSNTTSFFVQSKMCSIKKINEHDLQEIKLPSINDWFGSEQPEAQPEAIQTLGGEKRLGDCGLPIINYRYESKLPKERDKSYSGRSCIYLFIHPLIHLL